MNDERVSLVNKNDEVNGEKWRSELKDSDGWRISMVWVKDGRENYLLEQRSFKKTIHPGAWTPACVGTVTAGDTPIETAVRELKEEIGLRVNVKDLVPTGKVFYKDPQLGSRMAFGYVLEIKYQPANDFIIQKEELEQVKWFTREQISALHSGDPSTIPIFEIYKKLNFF